MIDFDRVLDFLQAALVLALQLSIPVLVAVIVVGVATNLIQAIFQLQDQSLSLVPRMIAVALVLALMAPTMLEWIVTFTRDSFQASADFLSGG